MNNARFFLALLVVAASSAFAGEPSTTPVTAARSFTPKQLALIEQNLALCLESPIVGIRATAALTVREMNRLVPEYSFDATIIPLMRIVKGDDYDHSSRTAAALALHELASARGDFAIKQAARFSSSERMRKLYWWLVYERSRERNGADSYGSNAFGAR